MLLCLQLDQVSCRHCLTMKKITSSVFSPVFLGHALWRFWPLCNESWRFNWRLSTLSEALFSWLCMCIVYFLGFQICRLAARLSCLVGIIISGKLILIWILRASEKPISGAHILLLKRRIEIIIDYCEQFWPLFIMLVLELWFDWHRVRLRFLFQSFFLLFQCRHPVV